MTAAPWMKFYPQDWRADEKLRLCSLSARGLWIEMLAIMHRSERYGQLLISGNVPTDAQLAVQVGALPHEVAELVGQLESAGVFSRAASGAIYSRRMTRDYKKAKIAQKNGKNGGNPTLSKQTDNSASDKGQVKGEDKPQRPEARDKTKANALAKTLVPEGWEPRQFGIGSQSRSIVDGWSSLELKRQIEAFCAHHRTRQNRFTDWQDVWSTWVLNSVKFGRQQGPAEPASFLDHYTRKAAAGGGR